MEASGRKEQQKLGSHWPVVGGQLGILAAPLVLVDAGQHLAAPPG